MPDEKKLSVSSDDSMMEDGFETKFLVAGMATGKVSRICGIVSCAVIIVQALLAGLAVLACAVCVYCVFFAARPSFGANSQPLYINLVIDMASIPSCTTPMTQSMQLPCIKDRKLVTGRKAVGPMKCWDDAHSQSAASPNNCAGNPFVLVGADVIIPETGVYMVHSMVTFDDPLDDYLSSTIRITPARCLANATCANSGQLREQATHSWLSCFNHNGAKPPGVPAKSGNKFSTCSIDGLRRFDRGDTVSLMTSLFRLVNPFHKLTHVTIHRL